MDGCAPIVIMIVARLSQKLNQKVWVQSGEKISRKYNGLVI